MKTLLAMAALLVAAPVQAAVVDPVDYTVQYCRMRAEGATMDEATSASVFRNIDHSREATVLPDGVDLDIRLGYLGIKELCPEFAFNE